MRRAALLHGRSGPPVYFVRRLRSESQRVGPSLSLPVSLSLALSPAAGYDHVEYDAKRMGVEGWWWWGGVLGNNWSVLLVE